MFTWQATVQDEAGNIVPLPVVTVYQSDGSTLADIYDETGTSLSNPLTGTLEGLAQFWANPGKYRIIGTNGGVTSEWFVDGGGLDSAAIPIASHSVAGTVNVNPDIDVLRVMSGGRMLEYIRDPSGTALQTADGAWWSPAGEITPQHWGAVADGVVDDTAVCQAAIDFAFYVGRDVRFPAGVYSVSGLRVYGIWADNMHATVLDGVRTKIVFDPKTVLKLRPGTKFGIRTWETPTAAKMTDEVLYGSLINPVIDMSAGGDVGILLECAHYWRVEGADIRNVPAGDFSYDDGHLSGAQTYPRTGIMLKGITGVAGTYSNRIINPFIRGKSTTERGNHGIWIGTTLGQNNQRANFNYVEQGAYTCLSVGISMIQGFNQTLESPNAFDNTTNIYVNTGRNLIIKPYLELSAVGIEFTSNSKYNVLFGLSSVASSTVPVIDNGVDNVMFPEAYLPRICTVDAQNAPTDQAVPANVWTKVNIARATYDTSNMADLVNNRIVIDANGDGEGFYLLDGNVRMTTHDGYVYELMFQKNGVDIVNSRSMVVPGANVTHNIKTTGSVYLSKGDYVEMIVRSNYGVGETITSNANTGFTVVKQLSKLNVPFNR